MGKSLYVFFAYLQTRIMFNSFQNLELSEIETIVSEIEREKEAGALVVPSRYLSD